MGKLLDIHNSCDVSGCGSHMALHLARWTPGNHAGVGVPLVWANKVHLSKAH